MTYARSEELFGLRVQGESVVDSRSIPMLQDRKNIRAWTVCGVQRPRLLGAFR